MKRFAAALVALALLLGATALAFRGEGYPSWDGASAPVNGLCASLGGERIALSFDPSQEYSNVLDGVVTACFFAYDAAEANYLELYLLLPQSAASGDVYRSGEALKCSILLYETFLGGEDFYYAGDADGSSAGSYELTLESVESSSSAISMQGRFTARMCRYDRDQPTRDVLDVGEARFSFTLPLTSSPAPTSAPGDGFPPGENMPALPEEPSATFPALPGATEAPGNAFPALPEEPGATFPALPGATEAPGNAFPALPDIPRSGTAPSFTLPPDYVTL